MISRWRSSVVAAVVGVVGVVDDGVVVGTNGEARCAATMTS